MKLSRKQFDILLFALLAVWLVATDRVFKSWAAQNLQMGSIGYDFGPIALTLVHNSGAAFGMGQGGGMLFVAMAAIIVIAIVVWIVLAKQTRTIEIVSLGLIAAGGIGNCIDRLTTGYVVDFIQFTFVDFPVFNIADMCITIGVVLLFVTMFSHIHADEKKIKASLDEKAAAQQARREAQVAKAKAEAARRAGTDAEDAEWEADVAAYEAKYESENAEEAEVGDASEQKPSFEEHGTTARGNE